MAGQYQATVCRKDRLTPHLIRLEVCGEDLAAFPADQESGYVKLAFSSGQATVMRSYTVRAFDLGQRTLTLDFVDHGDGGPASAWANRASVGEAITLRGPGEKKLVDPQADWFIVAGDLSALPAISVNLEKMPTGARGFAVIEVPSSDDIQLLEKPDGIQLDWVVNDDSTQPNVPLVRHVRELPWLDGTPYPWFAGEFSAMRDMRTYFRDERGIDRRRMYLSCYWKLGDTDEGMKRAKRADAETDAASLAAVS